MNKVISDGNAKTSSAFAEIKKSLSRDWQLYLLVAPVVLYFAVFRYLPLYGIQIAFKKFIPLKGVWGSPWVGFEHFTAFFNGYNFWRLISNTLIISLYQLCLSFPVPIILALLVNEVRSKGFKKTVQMVTYAPHFLSLVVLVGMLVTFLSPSNGVINRLIVLLGGESIYFMAEPGWFKTVYVLSGVWQNAGWSSIIYMATLAGIDQSIYEAATVDGASKLRKIIHITIPGIMPTAVILLIMDLGRVMNVGFEKIFLMQNALNMSASDVISTFVYRSGIIGAQYSSATAIGLFNSVINFLMLLTVNSVAKKTGESSLW